MEYEVQLIPIDKAVIVPGGFLESLCTSCSAPDCTNPIEEREVSFAGRMKKIRLHVINNTYRQVVTCKGYVGDVIQPMDNQQRSF